MTQKIEVGIVMGSDSDWKLVKPATETLRDFDVGYEVRVISAHRTPEIAYDYASTASDRGLKVLISAAGGAAHLGGVIAAHTVLPVIGIPIKDGALNGLDALLATLQMPSGIPVATVTLGSAGPINAAILATQMIAIGNPQLTKKLIEFKKTLKEKVAKGNARVQEELK